MFAFLPLQEKFLNFPLTNSHGKITKRTFLKNKNKKSSKSYRPEDLRGRKIHKFVL
nr:MAG TPA: hypothetical protein [Caudoviricetes sp.]